MLQPDNQYHDNGYYRIAGLMLMIIGFSLCISMNLTAGNRDTALVIADVSIPASHFEHWLSVMVNQEHAASAADVSTLIETYRDRLYYFADAVDHGIDRNPAIDDEVNCVAKTIMTQRNGPLHTATVLSKIEITDTLIDDAYDHQDYLFEVEYWHFPLGFPASADTTELSGLFSATVPSDYKLVDAAYSKAVRAWPYLGLYSFRESIYSASPGDCMLFHDESGDYVVHILKRNVNQPRSRTELAEYLRSLLQLVQQDYFEKAYEARILRDSGFRIDPDILDLFASRLAFSDTLHHIELTGLDDIASHILCSYTRNDTIRPVTVRDFILFYNNMVIRKAITSEDDLAGYIKECVFEDLAYTHAMALGLTDTDSFLAERESYYHRVVNNYYDQYLLSQINPTKDEIRQEYTAHLPEFTEATACKASIIRFDNPNSAMRAALTTHPETADPATYTALPGCIGVQRDVELTQENCPFAGENIRGLFSRPGQKTLQPFVENDITYLIVKHSESGTYIIPLDDVRDQIVQALKQQKLEKLKAEMLPELRKKYTLIDNIDYNKYLSDEWIANISNQ